MKTASSVVFQGDVMLRRVNSIPQGLKETPRENGQLIVTHSETGHHHIVDAPPNIAQLWGTDDPLKSFLSLKDTAPLVHLRAWDTHETWELPAGNYEVVRQRELRPEGWARVID